MNKRILRSISIILVIVFLVSAPVYAMAAEARASAWFTGYGASVVASGVVSRVMRKFNLQTPAE